MSVRALVIDEQGSAEVRQIEGNLDSIKGIVGGWIEAIGPVVNTFGAWHGYVDEEGKLKHYPVNLIATSFAISIGWGGAVMRDTLHGPVVFLGDDTASGNESDVPVEVLRQAVKFYREYGAQIVES